MPEPPVGHPKDTPSPPGFWKRFVQRLDRWQRSLPLTIEGKIWLLLSVGMLMTGLWRGINLIVLLSCCLVMAILYNWRLAGRQIKRLTGKRICLEPFFALEPARVAFEVYNPSPAVVGSVWLGQDAAHWYVPQLEPKRVHHVHGRLTFLARGKHHLGPLIVRSGFPLGLADCRREVQGPEPVIVLPRLGVLRRGLLRRLLQQHSPTLGLTRTVPRRHPTAQTEFHGLRSFQPGDSPRWIHWRTTARRGELMVREFEETPSDNLILLVDTTARPDEQGNDPHLETAISLAATICWEWCRQKGDHLVLGIAGAAPSVCQGVTGRELALQMLEQLAVATGSPDVDAGALLEQMDLARLPVAPLLVVGGHASGFAETVRRAFHRHVAVIDVSRGDHEDFFEERTV
jgi:uncharacterized protein (DUF58 family)